MTNKTMLSVEQELRALAEKACGTAKDSPEYRRFLEAVNPTIVLDLTAEPAAQHQGEPTPITGGMDRLMEAYRLGEFSDEGGSDTVEALSVASFDAAESHGHDADSYMAGYCAALYEQAKPFIWLALKPKQQVEPVRWERMSKMGNGAWRPCANKEEADEAVKCGYTVRPLYAEQPYSAVNAELKAELEKYKAGCVDLSSQVRELEHKMDFYRNDEVKEELEAYKVAFEEGKKAAMYHSGSTLIAYMEVMGKLQRDIIRERKEKGA